MTSAQRTVLGCLRAHCFNGPICWPSQELLAKETGYTRKTINKAVKWLEAEGHIEITKRRRPGAKWDHNVYRIRDWRRPVRISGLLRLLTHFKTQAQGFTKGQPATQKGCCVVQSTSNSNSNVRAHASLTAHQLQCHCCGWKARKEVEQDGEKQSEASSGQIRGKECKERSSSGRPREKTVASVRPGLCDWRGLLPYGMVFSSERCLVERRDDAANSRPCDGRAREGDLRSLYRGIFGRQSRGDITQVIKKSLILAALIAGVLAPPAQARVLVFTPGSLLECGDAIQVGLTADLSSTDPRNVKISVMDWPTRKWWWKREALAYNNRWRYWYLPSGKGGRCHTTIVKYRGNFLDGRPWTLRFVVRFKDEAF